MRNPERVLKVVLGIKAAVGIGALSLLVFVLAGGMDVDAHPVSACPSPGKIVWVAYGTRQGPAKVQRIRVHVLADDVPAAFARVKVVQPNMTVETLSVVATVDAVIVESSENE